MAFKHIAWLIVAIGLMNISVIVAVGEFHEIPQDQPKVFDNGEHTIISGNDLAEWFAADGLSGSSSALGDVIAVECCENDRYGKQFSLAELKRIRKKTCKGDCSQRCVRQMNEKFTQYVQENNAVFCPDVIQQLNGGDGTKNISAIIVGVKAVSHCDSYKKLFADIR